MKKRPRSLILLALILFGIALSIPVQIMVLYEHSFNDFEAVWNKLTYMNLAVMALSLVNAVLLIQGSRFVLYVTPVLIGATILNNYWVGLVATDYTLATTFISSALFILCNGLILTPGARMVLLHPSKRWWRVAPRKKAQIPVTVMPWLNKSAFIAPTFDISESGAFVRLQMNEKNKLINLNPDDNLEIKFQLGGFYQIRCSARVVRVDKNVGSYPSGMGIQFQEMTAEDKNVLKRFLKGDLSL